jgi:hypothetical protein
LEEIKNEQKKVAELREIFQKLDSEEILEKDLNQVHKFEIINGLLYLKPQNNEEDLKY